MSYEEYNGTCRCCKNCKCSPNTICGCGCDCSYEYEEDYL